MHEMTWKINNNWMEIAFYHPSESTADDPKADKRFALELFEVIQDLCHRRLAHAVEHRTDTAKN